MFKRVGLLAGAIGVFTLVISFIVGTPLASAVTPAPTLVWPASSSAAGTHIPVQFNLPVAPGANSVKLIFAGSTTYTITLSTSTSGTSSFSLNNTSNLLLDPHVNSVTPSAHIPDGLYTVTLSYQNAAFDPAATSTSTNVTLDSVAPVPTSLSPANNQTSVATTSPLTITFGEIVTAGVSTIDIRKTADNSLVESIPVSSGQLTGSGTNTITITPTALQPGTAYTVSAPDGAFFDLAGNGVLAFSWQFTTAAAATTTSSTTPTTPQLADTGFSIWVLETLAWSMVVAAIITRLFPLTTK